MSRRPVHLLLSAVGYLGFTTAFAWTVVFLAGVVVHRTVDGPVHTSAPWAVTADLALLLLFAAQHSVMARRPVKARLRRWVPEALERTTYVLAADACLVLLLALWQPWGEQVWSVHGIGAVALWSLCAAGWLLAGASTFAVDHLELFGLRQAGWAGPRDAGATSSLSVRGLHALVRHPLMTGIVLAFWATPRMSASHLLFALASTAYVAVGIAFEEHDLRRTFGVAYDDYAAAVPALVPRPRTWRLRQARPRVSR